MPIDRRTLKEAARALLADVGLDDVEDNARVSPGVRVSARAQLADGAPLLFEFAGAHTPSRPGLARLDVVYKTIAKAAVVREATGLDLIVLTSGSVRGGPLAAVTGRGRPVRGVVDVTRADAGAVLRELADLDPP